MIPSKLALVFCIFFIPSPIDAYWDDLVVTWSMSGYNASVSGEAFYKLPTTEAAARRAGWNRTATDSRYWNIRCYNEDARICILYDRRGHIAGMDVGLPVEDYKSPYDFSLHPIFTNVTRFNTTVRKVRFFVVPQGVLKRGGRFNSFKGTGYGIWLQEGNKLTQIPLTESEIKARTSYVEQNCIPSMGKHYYYNTTTSLDCNYFEPIFLLTNTKTETVHGIGFQGFGTPSAKSRKWYEDVPAAAIKPTVPTAPDCLVDWVKEYGVISMHIYFVKSPWSITC